ncbi:hypothetical protein B0J17DRAFT_648396 [Rhizoctonia solani]|nr:hypothetical protein B0J17DRAFT_648396 [Rhizoctonia solani]
MAPPSPSRPKSTLKGKGRMNTSGDGDLFPALTYRHLHGQNLGVQRVIALCDNDAFYASCERVRLNIDPEQPLVVQQWTNLIAVNYPARKFGITRHESITDARKKCPNLMAVHVATYKEGDNEPQYWEDPSPTTHKVSLDHYRRESSRVFQLFQDMMPAGGEMEKASIDEVFIDYTIPVRVAMLERYPELRIPDGPFDLDTLLPVPPAKIDWAELNTHVIPVTSDSPTNKSEALRPITPSLGIETVLDARGDVPLSSSGPPSPDMPSADLTEVGSDAPPTWHDAENFLGDCEEQNACEASYRKPMAQSVLRNVAIPGYLGPMPQTYHIFPQIRFLGGKLGDAIATQFGATTVSELREIELGELPRLLPRVLPWLDVLIHWEHQRTCNEDAARSRFGFGMYCA